MPCVPYNMQVLGERDLELHDDEYEMASSLSNAFGFDDGDANRRDLWSGDLWSEGSSDESQRHAQPSPVNGDSSFVVEDLTVSQPGYCGVPNPNSFSLYPSRNKWLKKNLTYRFVNYPSGMSRERAEDALAEAFDLWRSVSTLTFQMLREGEADIMISFERRYHGDEFPFDGPHGVLAHAYEPSPGLGGDLHFDDEEQWSVGLIGYNLRVVAAHELGHALGLQHSNERGSIMNPSYQVWIHPYLSEDDKAGIRALYGTGPLPRSLSVEAPRQLSENEFTPHDDNTRPDRVHEIASDGHDQRARNAPHGALLDHTHHDEPTTASDTPDEAHALAVSCSSSSSGGTDSPLPMDSLAGAPRLCGGNLRVDAASFIHRQLYIFQGEYFWRVSSSLTGAGLPGLVSSHWPGAPNRIDALYANARNHTLVFFSGERVWALRGFEVDTGSPRDLHSLGLPPGTLKVDAAVPGRDHTLLFAGRQYWSYNEVTKRMDAGFPRELHEDWPGIPTDLDAAVTKNEFTFFIKGQQVFRMWTRPRRLDKVMNLTSWLGCGD
ncbi:stromelysin-1-like [Petromyzon marinus]|uniref:stromelysin-1-like n=1 Tax=Petromyzon marinus TaxID=7757 RepID=UPI003F6E4FC8